MGFNKKNADSRCELVPVVLCADDYGISPGVGRAIRELAEKERITATSCMTISPHWRSEGARLNEISKKIDLGLHLTLTNMTPLGPVPSLTQGERLPGISTLLRLSLRNRLVSSEIADEFSRQFDAFADVIGRAPDFIDGHEHIHQFPQIRESVIRLICRQKETSKIRLRMSWEAPERILRRRESMLRAYLIGAFGKTLRRMARDNGITCNTGFTGIYNPNKKMLDRYLMRRFMVSAQEGTIMMCHPGIVDDELRQLDSLIEPREHEYNFLTSDMFVELLPELGVRLSRWSEIS